MAEEVIHMMVRIKPEDHRALQKRAKKEQTTVSDLVRTAIRIDQEKYEKRQQK